jgi:hypothetical protein
MKIPGPIKYNIQYAQNAPIEPQRLAGGAFGGYANLLGQSPILKLKQLHNKNTHIPISRQIRVILTTERVL